MENAGSNYPISNIPFWALRCFAEIAVLFFSSLLDRTLENEI